MKILYRCVLGDSDKDDFISNYSIKATFVDDIVINENTAIVNKDYSEFKKLIDGDSITWDMVLYSVDRDITGLELYTLYLEL